MGDAYTIQLGHGQNHKRMCEGVSMCVCVYTVSVCVLQGYAGSHSAFTRLSFQRLQIVLEEAAGQGRVRLS